MRKCHILSGIPGSGKSTFADSLNIPVCSADDFFMNEIGEYEFDKTLLQDAHRNCFRKAHQIMLRGEEDVVIDNTNCHSSEITPYAMLAEILGYRVVVHIFHCDPITGYKRTKHGVPLDTIRYLHNAQKRTIGFVKRRPHWKVVEHKEG